MVRGEGKGQDSGRTHVAFEFVQQCDVVVGQSLDEDTSHRCLVVREGASEDLCSVCSGDDGGVVCVQSSEPPCQRKEREDAPSPLTCSRAWLRRRASVVVRCSPGFPMTRARTAAWQRVP